MDGAELLQAALERGAGSSEDEADPQCDPYLSTYLSTDIFVVSGGYRMAYHILFPKTSALSSVTAMSGPKYSPVSVPLQHM